MRAVFGFYCRFHVDFEKEANVDIESSRIDNDLYSGTALAR
jgi:hypothetical protein